MTRTIQNVEEAAECGKEWELRSSWLKSSPWGMMILKFDYVSVSCARDTCMTLRSFLRTSSNGSGIIPCGKGARMNVSVNAVGTVEAELFIFLSTRERNRFRDRTSTDGRDESGWMWLNDASCGSVDGLSIS